MWISERSISFGLMGWRDSEVRRTKQHMTKFVLILVIVLAMGFYSCNLEGVSGEGHLEINLGSRSRNSDITWEPGIEMDTATYTISGAGPSGNKFMVENFSKDEKSFTKDSLAVGVWEITVDGYNVDKIKIGTAKINVTIKKSQKTTATVSLKPLVGTGNLDLTVSWTDSQSKLADPRVTVVISEKLDDDIISGPIDLPLDGGGNSASKTIVDLPTGWYKVKVGLYEGLPTGSPEAVWEGIFILRIVKDQNTSGEVVIPESQIQFGTGNVAITLKEDMGRPFTVAFTKTPETVEKGEVMTFTSTETYSNTVQYQWYVNGSKEGTNNPTFTYRFDKAGESVVTLLVLNGGVLAGYAKSIVVIPVYKVRSLGPTGGYIFYDKGSYSDGWRYLEAAPAGWNGTPEDPKYIFGIYRTSPAGPDTYVGTTSIELGTGKANTEALVTAMGNSAYLHNDGHPTESAAATAFYAAKVSSDLSITVNNVVYDDWFLPSERELYLMYQELAKNNLGGFSKDNYWSSSEKGHEYYAHSLSFTDGIDAVGGRYSPSMVRPVRAF